MNEKIKKDLEELRERYMQDPAMAGEADELSKFMAEKLALPIEAARKQEMEERALSKKLEDEAIQQREQQGQEEADKKIKAMRMAEYEKEMEEKGYADKSRYSDLFPQEEISPMEEEKKRKKQLGYE